MKEEYTATEEQLRQRKKEFGRFLCCGGITEAYYQLIVVGSRKESRSQLLTLTPQGRKAVEEAIPLWERAQPRFVKQLGEKRWRIL